MRQIFTRCEIAPTEEHFRKLTEAYIGVLPVEMANPGARVLGGVKALLEEAPRRALTGIAGAILVLFVAGAGPVCLYFTTCVRYQLEFVPALVLLAAIGFLAIASAGEPGRPRVQALLGASACAAAASSKTTFTASNELVLMRRSPFTVTGFFSN